MSDSLDQAIAAVARRQHGNVTRQQLSELGLSSSAIGRRAASGTLHRVFVGVYAVGVPPRTPVDRAAAAVLACGRGAALSHESAAALWGWRTGMRPPFHVSAPTCHRRPGIRIHRLPLTRADVRHHVGIRVTSPARTVLDLAPGLSDRRLLRLVGDARIAGQLHLAALLEAVERSPAHRGAPRLRELVWPDRPTRSHLEDAFLAFVHAHDLPRPQINARVGGMEVDALFAEEGVVVELDGWAYHAGRGSFEGDRDRDADRLAAGLETVRLTWWRLRDAPAREAERLRRILERRRRERAA